MTLVASLIGLAAPGAASAAYGTTLEYLPGPPIAGLPVELTYRHDAPSAYYVYAYQQSPQAACALKPSLQSNDQVSIGSRVSGSDSGPSITRRTITFTAATTIRICVYLQPQAPCCNYNENTPLAVTPIDITIREPASTLAVAGVPSSIAPPARTYRATFTTTTEAPSTALYQLVPGGSCPAAPASNEVFESSGNAGGGATVWTNDVDLSGAAQGTYTWCGFVSLNSGSGYTPKGALGSVVIATPPPAPAKPQPPACALVDGAAKRGTAVRVRCYRVSGTAIRVRYKRKGRTVTKVVTLKNGIARAGTRGLAYGRWSVSFLADTGKVGSGKVTVRRR